MDIPDYVMDNEIIKSLHAGVTDMLAIGNDLCSYSVEQARGDGLHNIVTAIMHELQLDVQGAFDWIGKYHNQIAEKFLQDYSKVPSWGQEVDQYVGQYIDGLGNWVRENDQWCSESQRYFGIDGLRIIKDRAIKPLPKKDYISVKPELHVFSTRIAI
ncbi:isoprenoid synthase domain-containing protein [Cyathus striatus]|nr:isoprenoid synthase domain-containing protein [Cyathus striatus]